MNDRTPLVAVATPVYNGGEFLAETMACVQAQTYPSLVHVLLDNASTDTTPEIIRSFSSGSVPVVAVRNVATVPLEENWNRCLGLVTSEAKYIRILCADDTMTADSIAKMVDVAERNPGVGLVGCEHNRGGSTERSGWPLDRERFSGREATASILLGDSMILATHVLMLHAAVDPAEPMFKRGLRACDTQACLRILNKYDWAFIHEDLAFTREHPSSVTSLHAAPTQVQFYEMLALLKEFGSSAFGPEGYAETLRRFRRQYRRRILRWRLVGDTGLYEPHLEALSGMGERPTLLDNIDAVIDHVACKLGLRPRWTGYPFFG